MINKEDVERLKEWLEINRIDDIWSDVPLILELLDFWLERNKKKEKLPKIDLKEYIECVNCSVCYVCKVRIGEYHQPYCSAGNGIFYGPIWT